jgi:Flp pilus assembly pilin Flp
MKKKLLFILFPFLVFGQTQIGGCIIGEAAGDESGDSIALSYDGKILAIGGFYNAGNGIDSGSVRVYENKSGTWTQLGIDIDGEAAGDFFGSNVSLSRDGSILAISAAYNGGNGPLSGSVSVYKYISGTWTKIGADIDGEAAYDQSGWGLSLSADGATLAIGSPKNSGNGEDSGSVRVYKNISGNWTQIGFDIDGEAAGDQSGAIVSLSGDGAILAIGAPENDGNGKNSGSVRVYKNISGTWTKIGVDIDGEAAGDQSSWGLALSDDGTSVAIGAPNNGGNGASSGSVRVYKNIAGMWTPVGLEIDGEAANDYSGAIVSLSADGTTLAIGAPENDGNGLNSGSVRVYKNISGTWTKIGADIDGEAAGDQSSWGLALSADGTALAIGAIYNDRNGISSGSVRAYDLSSILGNNLFVISNFSISPNPASEYVNISLQEDLALEKVNIYTILGQLVKTENSTSITVSNLSKGLYIFEIITNKGRMSKKILVN